MLPLRRLMNRFRPQLGVSRYNTLVSCDDGWLLHSQMKGTLLLLDEQRKADYERIVKGDFKAVPKSFVKRLHAGGFLKPKDLDERNQIAEVWNLTVNAPQAKALTIVTTDRCNLGCTYCFEAKTEWRMMDEKVQQQLEVFIQKYLTSTPTSSLGVTWFGGEPTLNMQCIERLTKFIDALCKQHGIAWHPYIITNGTTLTEKVVDRLVACQLKRLQITVDGIKEDHDVMRPYLADMKIEDMNEHQIHQRRQVDPSFGLSLTILDQAPASCGPRSSFEDIIRNVGTCYEKGLEVSLRINVDNRNKDRIQDLYEMIAEKGWLKRSAKGGLVSVYTHAVFDGCSSKGCEKMSKKEHAELDLSLNKFFKQKTSDGSRRGLTFTGDTCTANKKFQFVINPGGAILKCWHHATDDSHGIGHISNLDFASKGTDGRDKYDFDPMKDPECYECPVLPICMGGCKANNRFAEEGYAGEHERGCISSKHVLPEEIRHLYELAKEGHLDRTAPSAIMAPTR